MVTEGEPRRPQAGPEFQRGLGAERRPRGDRRQCPKPVGHGRVSLLRRGDGKAARHRGSDGRQPAVWHSPSTPGRRWTPCSPNSPKPARTSRRPRSGPTTSFARCVACGPAATRTAAARPRGTIEAPSKIGIAGRDPDALPFPVGRIYERPRTTCRDCGSRVLELLYCYECGDVSLGGFVDWVSDGTVDEEFLSSSSPSARSEPPAGLQARSNGVPLVPARHHLGPSLPVHGRRPKLRVPACRPRTGNGPAHPLPTRQMGSSSN